MASRERERPRFEIVLARIDAKIGELRAIRRDLLATLNRCRDGTCTLLETVVPGMDGSSHLPEPPEARQLDAGSGRS